MAIATIPVSSVGDPFTASIENAIANALNGSAWTTATLGNSWVSYDGGAVYAVPAYKTIFGMVVIEGMMKSGTTGTTVFTLPSGMQPLKALPFICVCNAGAARVDVAANGVVSVAGYISTGSNAFVSLNGITFVAEQ